MVKTRSHGDGSIYYRHNAAGQTSRVCVELMIGTTVAADGTRHKQMWRASAAVKVPGDPKSTDAARKEAERALKAAIKEHHRGELFGGSDQALGDYLAAWLRDTIAPRARPRTTLTYRLLLEKHVYPTLGRLPLRKLTAQHLQALYAQRLKEVSPGTVKLLHQAIKQSLKDALRSKLVPHNVAEFVDPPRVPHKEMTALTVDEARRFLAAAESSHLYPLWLTLLYTGLRIGEALALRWSDVDLAGSTAHIRRSVQRLPGGGLSYGATKTKRGERDVPLPPVLVAQLRTHRKTQAAVRLEAADWQDGDIVFANSIGHPVDSTTIRRDMAAVLDRAKLPKMRVHDLRHSAATILKATGADMFTISRQLGHSSIGITANTYTETVTAAQREAVDRLGDALG